MKTYQIDAAGNAFLLIKVDGDNIEILNSVDGWGRNIKDNIKVKEINKGGMTMTREEEITLASKQQKYSLFSNYGDAFVSGAQWADNHPKSPWISANDALPEKEGHYLCMDDYHNVTTLDFCGDKWINSRAITDVPLEIVRYWMPFPKLPKE